MTISKLRVTCRKCKHVFDAEYVTDAPVAVAVASMQAIRCEQCGADVGLGGNYKDAPAVIASIIERVGWWKTRGERGTSSNTIFSAFTGESISRDFTPVDPDDFKRCRQLLDLIPLEAVR